MSSKHLRVPTKNAKRGSLSYRESIYGILNVNMQFYHFEDGTLSDHGTKGCQMAPSVGDDGFDFPTNPPETSKASTRTHASQKLLPFDGSKEAERAERVRRLLSGLGQPATKLTSANLFDYNQATLIATAGRRPE